MKKFVRRIAALALQGRNGGFIGMTLGAGYRTAVMATVGYDVTAF